MKKLMLLVLLIFGNIKSIGLFGQKMEVYNLFSKAESPTNLSSPSNQRLKSVAKFDLADRTLTDLIQKKPSSFRMSLPRSTGEMVLELHKVQLTDQEFTMVEGGSKLAESLGMGVFYQGKVAGDPNSMVAISCFKDQVSGNIITDNKAFVIGQRNKSISSLYTLEQETPNDVLDGLDYFSCATQDVITPHLAKEIVQTNPNQALAPLGVVNKVVNIHFECDFDMYIKLGSNPQSLLNYVTSMFNLVQAIYRNESILTRIKSVKYWSSPDPYATKTNTYDALKEFGNQLRAGVPNGANVAHLLSTRSLGGGIAWLDMVCRTPFYSSGNNAYVGPFAVSAINTTFSQLPSYSWTIEVVTHEMGHTLGSPHTQSCSWTGGALDNCYPTEGSCSPGPAPVNGGTIMSYCHLTKYGINFNNGFGTQPGNLIRNRVAAQTCLNNTADAVINVSTNTLSFNKSGESATVNITTSPIDLFWAASDNASWLNLSLASGTGAAALVVTADANTTPSSRFATVTIAAENAIQTISIIQPVCNSLPTITNATSIATCFSANQQTTPLTYSATTGSPTTYSITWNAAPSNSFAAVNNATLTASSIGIMVPAGTIGGTYTGNLTVKNADGCVSASKTFTVIVNALPTISASAMATTVCQSSAAQTTTLSYSVTSGTPTAYSIAWNSTPTNKFLAVNNTNLTANSISITVPANTAAGTYSGTLTVRNANGCISIGVPFTITVNPLPSIASTATATGVCQSSASQLTNLSYSTTTASPTSYNITWNTTPTNSFTAVTNASLPSNNIGITIPANAAAGTYTGNLTVKNANGCTSTSKTFKVTVIALPTITNTAAIATCFSPNQQITPLTYSATSGTPTTYSIAWNATPSNSFATLNNATLTASSIGIVVPAGTIGGTYTGNLTVKNANGCVSANKTFTTTVNALPSITASAAATSVCQSAAAQTSSLSYSATSGAPTTYSIAWNSTPTNAFVTVNNANLTANAITVTVPANTAAGTYTGTLTVRNANGCISTGVPFTITVNPLPSIASSATASKVCQSSVSQLTNLSYSSTTTSPVTYRIAWNTTPTNSFAAVTNVSLPANNISITVPANAAVGTYTGNLIVSNANGCVSTSKAFTVAVNALPTITTATTAAAVCSSTTAQTTTLTYSATTGSPTTYSLTWNTTPTNTFKTIVDTALTTSPIVLKVPANTPPGIYTGIIKVRNANGCESVARTFTITVNALISITAAATTTDVTASTASQTTPLAYSATTGTPNTYSISWSPTPVNSFAAVSNTLLPASPIRITVPANTPAGTYTGNLTVRNAGGCVSAPRVFTVTVTGIAAIVASNIYEVGNTTGLSLNNGIPPADPDKAELLQNIPNPFHDYTQIGFYLPKSTDAYLTIRDEKGAVVYRQKAAYFQGWNQVTIKNSDLKAIGVLYYTLDTSDFSATKKMILLQK